MVFIPSKETSLLFIAPYLNPAMTDDLKKKALKKAKSYLGRIPSQHFGEEEYDLFLSIATPVELEEDIITRETFQKITNQLEWD